MSTIRNLPGPGDRATWPRRIVDSTDPDYLEWEGECTDCFGEGVDEDGDQCSLCNGLGIMYENNIGELR